MGGLTDREPSREGVEKVNKTWVKLTCLECGKQFSCEVLKTDNCEEWANEHITICPACLRQDQADIKETKQLTKLGEILGGYVLPQLVGTEKQVAWASKIRTQMILDAGAIYNISGFSAPTPGKYREMLDSDMPEYAKRILHMLCDPDAKWFIEHR